MTVHTPTQPAASPLLATDPEIAAAIAAEAGRQDRELELIASENYCSRAVREAVGSVLTNKYAEGYPGRRYYGGCEHVDTVESLARSRAQQLFGAEFANVQPHSGSQANMAVLMALLAPGDTYLAMDLSHGGHLTHGHPLSFSGQLFKPVAYGVERDSERVDLAAVARLAQEHRPKLILAGASAYPRMLDFPAFAEIACSVGALFMVDMAHIAGLVAAGVHPSPVPYADVVTLTTHKSLRGPRGGLILASKQHGKAINSKVFPGIQGGPLLHVIAGKAVAFALAMAEEFRTYQQRVVANCRAMADEMASLGYRIVSGGTDTHLLLVDLRPKGLRGSQVQAWLGAAGIVANKNVIPFDDQPPSDPSGVRIGTPSLTSRGADEADVRQVARWIDRVLRAADPEAEAERLRPEVLDFCRAHPIPE